MTRTGPRPDRVGSPTCDDHAVPARLPSRGALVAATRTRLGARLAVSADELGSVIERRNCDLETTYKGRLQKLRIVMALSGDYADIRSFVHELETAPELGCPWLGIFGGDEFAPADEVEKLRDAAASAEVATDIVRYPDANHRFDTDPASASEAWQRTLNWFDSHLR